MKNKKIYFVALTVAAAAILLGGCGKTDPATAVQQRAAERWNLLISHQPVKAYDYLSPGYRTTHTLDQYVAFIATARLKWKSVKITGQECDADACTVHLDVTSTIPGQLAGTTRDIEHEAPVTERWVASDGQWYFLPDSGIKPSTLNQDTKGDTGATTPPPAPAPAVQSVPAQPQPGADGK